jgi:hypothetical protein
MGNASMLPASLQTFYVAAGAAAGVEGVLILLPKPTTKLAVMMGPALQEWLLVAQNSAALI